MDVESRDALRKASALLRAGHFDADELAEALNAWEALPPRTSLAAVLQVWGLCGELNGGDGYPSTLPVLTELGEPDAPEPAAPVVAVVEPIDGSARYDRRGIHARGGIGRVWIAMDTKLGREVALKELRPEKVDIASTVSRFSAEARLTGQLGHPGIATVFDVGTDERGKPFYTMRFIGGQTLQEACRNHHLRRAKGKAGALEGRKLLDSFIALCNIVAYAHSRGVIHRDLKGKNVKIGEFGEVILLDWGLAKRDGEDDRAETEPAIDDPTAGRDPTIVGRSMGTPAYMAPEQARGETRAMGRPTDVYGLGAILYEILAGRPPFVGIDHVDELRQARTQRPLPPGQHAPGIPGALGAICMKALAERPEGRYGSPLELAEEVRRHLADEPVSAYPEPIAERLGRLVRRHRPIAASVATLMLVSVVGLSLGLWLVGRERDRAIEARAVAESMRDAGKGSYAMIRHGLLSLFEFLARDPAIRAAGAQPLRDRLAAQAAEVALGVESSYWADGPARLDAALLNRQSATFRRLSGRLAAALIDLDRTIATLKDLRGELPDSGERRSRLAEALEARGEVLVDLGQTAEAEAAFGRAIAEADALGDRPAGLRSAFRVDVLALARRAELRLRQGRLVEAKADVDRASGILDGGPRAIRPTEATEPDYLDGLAGLYARLGEAEPAEALRREAARVRAAPSARP